MYGSNLWDLDSDDIPVSNRKKIISETVNGILLQEIFWIIVSCVLQFANKTKH